MLDGVLFLRGHDAVLEGEFFGIIDRHSFARSVPIHTVEEQVMNRQTLQTGDVHCLARIHTSDITERKIAPFGVELTLIIAIRRTATSG